MVQEKGKPLEMRRFPAEIEFAHLSSVNFSAPKDPMLEEGLAERKPTGWDLSSSYLKAHEDRYLAKITIKARFDEPEEEQAAENEEDQSEDVAEDKDPPYQLEMVVTAGIHVLGSVPDKFISGWLHDGAIYLVIPYVRALLSQVMGFTGFEPSHFPLMTVPVFSPGDGSAIWPKAPDGAQEGEQPEQKDGKDSSTGPEEPTAN